MRYLASSLVFLFAFPASAAMVSPPSSPLLSPRLDIETVQRRTCRDARSCRDAVVMWCNGYRRADGDNDGIPCETVCRSRSQVNEIRREIGC